MKSVKDHLSTVKTVFKRFFKRYPELLSIPAAFGGWVASITILRWFDPTSGTYDAGVFQIPIFAIIQLLVYVSISWMLLGIVFGTARTFLKSELKSAFENLSSWEKIKYSYGLFFALLFALVALSYTLK